MNEIISSFIPTIAAIFFTALILIAMRERQSGKRKDDFDSANQKPPSRFEKTQRKEINGGKSEFITREERLGQIGEDWIAKILYESVPGEFQVFRNLYVPYRDTTTELDIVMVHETGIFVFESKNYSGWIYGSMEDLNWTQMFPNRKKRSFYNPVRQNRNHIKALSQYLNIPSRFFRSCIVFSYDCELRKVPETSAFTMITQTHHLEKELQGRISALPSAFRPEEIRAISERLLPLTNADKAVKEKHIEDIRKAQESNICPFCGHPLVLRESRYGSFFWGCSSYPRCKFTRNVTL